MTVTGSCRTDIVYYLPLQTDNGSMDDNWMLNAKLMEYQLNDNGPIEDGCSNKGWTIGRMHDGQII